MAPSALRVQALLLLNGGNDICSNLPAVCRLVHRINGVCSQDRHRSLWTRKVEGGGKGERDLVHIMGEGVPGWGSGGHNGTMTGIHGTFPRNRGDVILA